MELTFKLNTESEVQPFQLHLHLHLHLISITSHSDHSDHSDPRRPSAWPNSLTVGLRPADFPQTVAERSPQIPWKAPGTVGENGRPHRSGRGGRFYDD